MITKQLSGRDDAVVVGEAAPGWAPVVDAFRSCLRYGAEGAGAAMAVYLNGEEALSLHGGQDGSGQPWTPQTRAVAWSCTKGLLALCLQILVERDLVDVDKPVAEYWPEFARLGKDKVQVRHVLTHTAGLPYWEGYQEIASLGRPDGWDRTHDIVSALEHAPLQWAPGEALGYHGLTYGWILGELITRITGQDVGAFLQENVAQPLQAEVSIGPLGPEVPVASTLPTRVLASPAFVEEYDATKNRPDTISGKALLLGFNGAMYEVHQTANSPAFRRSLAAGANGMASARGLARIYGALANDGTVNGRPHLTTRHATWRHTQTEVFMHDLVNFAHNRFALGYQKASPITFLGPNDTAFGHAGLGGQLAFADPTTGLGFAFISNQPLITEGFDPRLSRLIASVYGVMPSHI